MLFGLKLGVWFFKLGGVFYGVETDEVWYESGAKLASLHFFAYFGLGLWINVEMLGSVNLLLINKIAPLQSFFCLGP